MLKFALCLWVFSGVAFGQAQPAMERIRKDVSSIQDAVNDAVNGAVPGLGVLQGARGAYLEGYGIVVSVEVVLEPPRNPFSAAKSPAEVRSAATARQKDVTAKLTNLLKQKVSSLGSIRPAESVAIIANLLNTNPVDLPDQPAQIVFSLKKQDASSGRVTIREYK